MIKFDAPRFQANLFSVTPLDCGIYEIRLTPPKALDDGAAFHYRAGQFCGLGLVNDAAHMRPYSIAGAPHHEYLEFHIRDNGRGLTAVLCDEARLGDTVYLTQGAGAVHLADDISRDIVMFAGGTGYAPMRAMLQSLVAQDFERKLDVFIGGRDLGALYMREELLGLREDMPRLSAYFCADEIGAVLPDVDVDDTGTKVHHGNLRALAAPYLGAGLADKRIYISGPPAMVMDIRDFALDNHAHQDFMHLDEENIAAFITQLNKDKA
jgi:CDP-4-dehydro-6-deoxyglucose reductase